MLEDISTHEIDDSTSMDCPSLGVSASPTLAATTMPTSATPDSAWIQTSFFRLPNACD